MAGGWQLHTELAARAPAVAASRCPVKPGSSPEWRTFARPRYDTRMAAVELIEVSTVTENLTPLPIQPAWILEGKPEARFHVLSRSIDGTARTVVWDCSAGRFNWYYDVDETVYILQGSVQIKKPTGEVLRVAAGDSVLFRAGSHAEWTVDRYVRKIAFFRNPVPGYAMLLIRAGRLFKRLFGRGGATGPSMSGA
jgi:uncharacterized cupin superfamily protein